MRKFSVSSLILAAISLVILTGSPALAHNELITTSPTSDSVVEAGPIRIVLSFAEAPLPLEFGQGNLIAVARAETGEQLGPACARIEGTNLVTTVNLQTAGKYKLLWRSASDDGHVASGEYFFTVQNNSNYSTDRIGNQCFDENGIELDAADQSKLSETIQPTDGLFIGLLYGIGFILVSGLIGAVLVKRRMAKTIDQRYE